MSQTVEYGAALHPFRVFEADVVRCARLSPSFLRVTFTGPDLDAFADRGFDQRCKLVLPLAGVGLAHLPVGPDWYMQWRGLPENLRNPIRTYTVRAVRQQLREVDVDFVVHDHGGPASRWASTAQPGAQAALIGPDARYPGDPGGIDFRPAGRVRAFLMAGDETAVPAISSILARLPSDACGHALLEVPTSGDRLNLAGPPEMRISWLGRDGAAHGSRLIPAVRAVAPHTLAGASACAVALDDPDVDTELLWEVPEPSVSPDSDGYAWLAGEAGVIKTLRRHLVTDLGIDRRSVAFMGYWRQGRSEPLG